MSSDRLRLTPAQYAKEKSYWDMVVREGRARVKPIKKTKRFMTFGSPWIDTKVEIVAYEIRWY